MVALEYNFPLLLLDNKFCDKKKNEKNRLTKINFNSFSWIFMSIIYHIFFRFFNRKTKKKLSKHYQSQIAKLGVIVEDEELSFIVVTQYNM